MVCSSNPTSRSRRSTAAFAPTRSSRRRRSLAETYSAHPAGRWVYVASFNASRTKEPLRCRVALADLGAVRPAGPVLAYDWRGRSWSRLEPDGGWDIDLPFQEWDYRVLCPLLPGDIAVLGDVTKYATAGDRRVAHITTAPDGVHFDVLGVPETIAEVRGYATRRPSAVTVMTSGETRTPAAETAALREVGEGWVWDAASGEWSVPVIIGPVTHTHVCISP